MVIFPCAFRAGDRLTELSFMLEQILSGHMARDFKA